MKFIFSKKLNDDLNDAITKSNRPLKGKITQTDIDRLNDDFMQDIYEVPFDDNEDMTDDEPEIN